MENIQPGRLIIGDMALNVAAMRQWLNTDSLTAALTDAG